jgi:hypothetical protein
MQPFIYRKGQDKITGLFEVPNVGKAIRDLPEETVDNFVNSNVEKAVPYVEKLNQNGVVTPRYLHLMRQVTRDTRVRNHIARLRDAKLGFDKLLHVNQYELFNTVTCGYNYKAPVLHPNTVESKRRFLSVRELARAQCS